MCKKSSDTTKAVQIICSETWAIGDIGDIGDIIPLKILESNVKLNDARKTGNYLKNETFICKVADLTAARLKILPAFFISNNSLT